MNEINTVPPEFKQALLETIQAIEDTEGLPNPLVFKWSFEEKPTWEIALGFRKVEVLKELN